MTQDDFIARYHSAAVMFAADPGPLAEALKGDEKARQEVADRLFRRLEKHGLVIVGLSQLTAATAALERVTTLLGDKAEPEG